MFSDDLGLGTSDGDYIKFDIIKDSYVNVANFMSCRIYHGDQARYKPVKIICGKFLSAITSSQTLTMALKIVNPALVGGQTSIPFLIYST